MNIYNILIKTKKLKRINLVFNLGFCVNNFSIQIRNTKNRCSINQGSEKKKKIRKFLCNKMKKKLKIFRYLKRKKKRLIFFKRINFYTHYYKYKYKYHFLVFAYKNVNFNNFFKLYFIFYINFCSYLNLLFLVYRKIKRKRNITLHFKYSLKLYYFFTINRYLISGYFLKKLKKKQKKFIFAKNNFKKQMNLNNFLKYMLNGYKDIFLKKKNIYKFWFFIIYCIRFICFFIIIIKIFIIIIS